MENNAKSDVKMENNVNAPHTYSANVPHQPNLSYGFTAPVYGNYSHNHGCNGFTIIVVLFILLIIVGTVCTFCS